MKLETALCCLLGLSACTAPAPAPAIEPAQTPTEAQPAAPDAEPSVGEAVPSPPPPLTVADIMGQKPDWLIARFGTPDLLRWEGSVQVFLYDKQGCVLDIILSEDGPDGYFQVSYVSTRDKKGIDIKAIHCIAAYDRGPAAENNDVTDY